MSDNRFSNVYNPTDWEEDLYKEWELGGETCSPVVSARISMVHPQM